MENLFVSSSHNQLSFRLGKSEEIKLRMKVKLFLLTVFIFASVCGSAQTPVDSIVNKGPRIITCGYPGVLSQFGGSDSGFLEYLKANIKYPEQERKDSIQGTVYISFVIEADGSVTNVVEMKGVPGGPGLTTEAIRVISGMPKWKPAMEDGKPVRMEMKQPVRYRLSDKTETKSEKIISCGPQIPEDSLGSIFRETQRRAECPVSWNEYINAKIPADQKAACDALNLYVSFIVLEDGQLVNVQLRKENENCSLIERSVLKAICEMPKWKPGAFNNNPVKSRVSMVVTIN